MKVGLYTDSHFCKSSSIISGKNNSTEGRLNNLIESFKWINTRFDEVGAIVDLGDLTDSTSLSSEEITALSECNLNNHIHILGNHSGSSADGLYNTINMYDFVLTKPSELLHYSNTTIWALPYINNPTQVRDYLPNINPDKDIILSHNDIKGIYYGNHAQSTSGFEVDDILNSCRLFINGHIHSGSWVVQDRILNLGAMTGLNFSVNNPQWTPSVAILDTSTYKVDIITNPKAIVFQKIECKSINDLIAQLDKLDSKLSYALQVKVPYDLVEDTKSIISGKPYVKYHKVLVLIDNSKSTDPSDNTNIFMTSTNVSGYAKLRSYIASKPKLSLELSDINNVIDELEKDGGE